MKSARTLAFNVAHYLRNAEAAMNFKPNRTQQHISRTKDIACTGRCQVKCQLHSERRPDEGDCVVGLVCDVLRR